MKVVESFCDSVREAIEPYLEGDLDAHEARRVSRHVARCPPCREELAWARRVLAGLRELPELTCPPGVEAAGFGAALSGRPRRRRRLAWGWLAAAAAVALAFLGGDLLLRPAPPPPPVAGPELAQAERDALIALTVLDSIHRRAAVTLRAAMLEEMAPGARGTGTNAPPAPSRAAGPRSEQ